MFRVGRSFIGAGAQDLVAGGAKVIVATTCHGQFQRRVAVRADTLNQSAVTNQREHDAGWERKRERDHELLGTVEHQPSLDTIYAHSGYRYRVAECQ